MLRRKVLGVILLYAVLLPGLSFAQTAVGTSNAPSGNANAAVYVAPKEVLDKIKDEGMNHSQVMKTLSYLSDVIGPRLTASPGMKRANEWTRDTLTSFGLQNADTEKVLRNGRWPDRFSCHRLSKSVVAGNRHFDPGCAAR